MIDPKEMQRTEAAPPVVIEQVRANGEVIFGDGSAKANPKSEIRRQQAGVVPRQTLNHQLSTIN
jgi:hypothetical protein